jgi:hypothetical protein
MKIVRDVARGFQPSVMARLKGSPFVCAWLAALAMGCHTGNTTGPSSTNSSTITRPTGAFAFRTSAIDPAFIEFIAPLGNLNPPGHTLPTDHIYFYHRLNNPSSPPRVVVAPADGTIQTIINNGSSTERKLLIAAAAPYTYYLDHVVPDATIREGLTLTAGQRVGVTGTEAYALDLGVFSDAVNVPFANPARYTPESLHGDAPLKYFAEPNRSQLYGLVRRSSGDRDGTFNYDIPGRLSGNWFWEQLPIAQTQNSSNWSLHLSFAYDNFDPASLRIASGGFLGFVAAPAVAPGTLEPRDVSPDTGKVVYRLLFGGGTNVTGVMIVQMLDANRIRIEYQSGDRTTADFTANARIYVR